MEKINVREFGLARQILMDPTSFPLHPDMLPLISEMFGRHSPMAQIGEDWKIARDVFAPPFQPRSLGHYFGKIIAEELANTERTLLKAWAKPVSIIPLMTGFLARAMLRGISSQISDEYILSLSSRKNREAYRDAAMAFLSFYRKHAGANDAGILRHLMDVRNSEGKPLSDQQIYDHTYTMFHAGLHSTDVTIALTLRRILQDKERNVLKDIQNEARKKPIDPEQIEGLAKEFPVITGELSETSRRYPALQQLIWRTVAKETTIVWHGLNVTAKPGDILEIDAAAINANPNSPRSLSFSSGPRVCPGQSLAMTEGTMCLHRLFGRFDMRLMQDFDDVGDYKDSMNTDPNRTLGLRNPAGQMLVSFLPASVAGGPG